MTVFKVNNRPVAKTWNGLVNDLFTDFDNNFGQAFGQSVTAPVNILESKDAYHLEVAAPGRSKDNFTLNVENNSLTIGYEEKKEAETADHKTIRREFSSKSFKRTFNLDEKINTESIEAKYEDGLLKVLLPKKEEVKPAVKQISIQ
jgi:HSP20 family protein